MSVIKNDNGQIKTYINLAIVPRTNRKFDVISVSVSKLPKGKALLKILYDGNVCILADFNSFDVCKEYVKKCRKFKDKVYISDDLPTFRLETR